MIEPRPPPPSGAHSRRARPMTRRTSGRDSAAVLCMAVGAFQTLRPSRRAATDSADLVFSNGKVVTVDERFTIAQAVAVKGDRIIAVGSNQDIAEARGSQHQDDRPEGANGHPRVDRQPSPSSARGQHVGAGAALGRCQFPQAGDRDASRSCEGRGHGRMGVQHRRLGHGTIHRRQEAFHARGTGRDRARQSGGAAGVLLSGLPEQPGPEGIRHRGRQARPARLRERLHPSRRGRKPTGIIRGDIAATRPVAARMPKLAPERLEASTEAL